MQRSELRSLFLTLVGKGLPRGVIRQQLKNAGAADRTIRHWFERHQQGKPLDGRSSNGKKATVVTKQAVNRVRHRLHRNPQRSCRKLAKDMHISFRSMWRILHEKLGVRPYKRRIAQSLTDAQKRKRLDRCKGLLRRFARGKHRQIVFFDEKIFAMQITYCAQNQRVYARRSADVPKKLRTVPRVKYPRIAHVGVAVSFERKFPLVFFKNGATIRQDNFRAEVLEPIAASIPLARFADRNWSFVMDGAPAHTARSTQAWCRAELPDFVAASDWPPNSPDLMPLDYYVNDAIEELIPPSAYRSFDKFVAAVEKAWENVPMDLVRKSIDSWPTRLRKCVRARGDYFE